MPLTKPIDETIVDNIAARLAGVDDSTIVRYRREPGHWTPDNRQIVIEKGDPERVPELDYPGNPPAVAWKMTVDPFLHIQQSETDTDDNTAIVSAFAAEVYQELCDASQWYQWDGTAIITDFGSMETSTPSGSFDAIRLPIIVTYRHSEGNPFEVRP